MPVSSGTHHSAAVIGGGQAGLSMSYCLTVPLHGVDPSHVVLATRASDHSRLAAAFRKSAQAHLTGPDPQPLSTGR